MQQNITNSEPCIDQTIRLSEFNCSSLDPFFHFPSDSYFNIFYPSVSASWFLIQKLINDSLSIRLSTRGQWLMAKPSVSVYQKKGYLHGVKSILSIHLESYTEQLARGRHTDLYSSLYIVNERLKPKHVSPIQSAYLLDPKLSVPTYLNSKNAILSLLEARKSEISNFPAHFPCLWLVPERVSGYPGSVEKENRKERVALHKASKGLRAAVFLLIKR